jgi:predicted nuclease of restriction endonuclease-like (RecB) superfamily
MDEINSDFSRGSAISINNMQMNKASKKVQDLKPRHLKTDPMLLVMKSGSD